MWIFYLTSERSFFHDLWIACNNWQKQPPKAFRKKRCSRNFTKFTGKHLCQNLLFKRKTLAQVFSCEFCEISKNTFFTEHLMATASYLTNKNILFLWKLCCCFSSSHDFNIWFSLNKCLTHFKPFSEILDK